MKGLSIIEILVVVAILAIAFTSIFSLLAFSIRLSGEIEDKTRALQMAEELMEIARSFRDNTSWEDDGLAALFLETPYFPQRSVLGWQLLEGQESIEGFERHLIFSSVLRDAGDNIVDSGGTLDPETKKVKSVVSWQDQSLEITSYFTNWQ